MKIGDIIRRERIKCGLSQEELAKSIGSTKQAIYKYESGIVSNIPMDKVEIIASRLGVTPSYLTGWHDEENPHELKLVTAFDKLSIDNQIVVSNWVEDLASEDSPKLNLQLFAEKNSPDQLILTEGEEMLIKLFRQIPVEKQEAFLEMGRLYANSLKKD